MTAIPAKGVKTESDKTQALLREVTQKKIAYLQSKHSLKDVEVYRLIKEFFKEYLHAHYEFTFDELVKELDKVYIEKNLRENVYKLLKDFSTIEYKDEEMPQETLQQVLATFSKLVDALIKSPTEKKQGFLSKLFGNGKEPSVKQAPPTSTADKPLEQEARAAAKQPATTQATPSPQTKEEPQVPRPAQEDKAQGAGPEDAQQSQPQEKPSQVPPSLQETPQEEKQPPTAQQPVGGAAPAQEPDGKPPAEGLDVPEPHKRPQQDQESQGAQPKQEGQEAEDGFQLPALPGEQAAQSSSQQDTNQSVQEQPAQQEQQQESQPQPGGQQESQPQQDNQTQQQSSGSLFPEEADPVKDEHDAGQDAPAGASAGWAEDPDHQEAVADRPSDDQAAPVEAEASPAEDAPRDEENHSQPAESQTPTQEQSRQQPAEQPSSEGQPSAEQSHDFYFGEDERQLSQDLDALAHQLDDVIHSDQAQPQQAQQPQNSVGTADTLQQLITTVERLIVERQMDEAKDTYKELIGRYHSLPEHAKHAYYEEVNRLYELLQRHG